MRSILAFLLLAAVPAAGQVVPGAALSGDPALRVDAGQDFFDRGKNLYDSAKAAGDPLQSQRLFDGASRVFRNYLVEFPDHENSQKAWWYLGDCHFKLGNVDDGRRVFSGLLSRYQDGVWVAAASFTLAADYYNRGEYALAAPLFKRYAEQIGKPEERARGIYFAGNCYQLNGKDLRAVDAFQELVDDPAGGVFVPKAELALAHLSVKLGRMDQAYDRFVAITGKDYPEALRGEALLHAALTARKLDKKAEAEGFLKQILASDAMGPLWADAQSALMANHFEREQYQEVLGLFSKIAGQGGSEHQTARLMLAGRAAMRLEQYPKALQWFREIERLVRPENEVAFKASYYRLMCFYRIEGSHLPDQVDAFLQLYREARPGDYRIHTALMMKAESLYAAGELAKAALTYNEVDAQAVSDKNRSGLLYQRGWCLAEAGDHAGAIRSLNPFIRSYQDDPRFASAVAKRAKSRVEVGDVAKAIADYDRLIAMETTAELKAMAWLESARLRRSQSQIEDMIMRYRGLLSGVPDLSENLAAEANYWIGWGLVKTNQAKPSIEHLEKARTLRADLYREHAGILLALGYFAAQDAQRLAQEVDLAIAGGYARNLPKQALRWSGMQSYNAGDFERAARFLELIATRQEPRETPKEVWRYLAKSQLEQGQAEPALEAVNNVLEVEDNPAWRADGLLDRGHALFALQRDDESRQAVDEALELQPRGRTRGSLRLLSGDLEMRGGNPQKASAQYLIVVSFMEDKQLKPLALSKLVIAFEAQQDAAQADRYRTQLQTEFPDWKAP